MFKIIYSFVLLVGIIVASGNSFGKEIPKSLVLNIAQKSDRFILTVPISRLAMSVPKNGLVSIKPNTGGATASPRYFHFTDTQTGLVISGWFESSASYSSFDDFWQGEKKSQAKAHAEPQNELRFTLAKWEAIAYDVPVGQQRISSNIRACWVASGTWIDINLSISGETNKAAVNREKLLALLRSILISDVK